MKKVGQFFFIFVPILLAFGLQFLATLFASGISVITEGLCYLVLEDTSADQFFSNLPGLTSQTDFSSSLMLIYALLVVAVFGLWYYIKYGGTYLIAPNKTFHPLSLLGILLLVPGGQFVTSYIVSFTSLLFPSWMEKYEKLMETAGLTNSITVIMFFYAVIIGPIAEELIFRGVTMRQAQKIFPFWAANTIQAFIFGIYHLNMIQGIYAFFVGLLLGYVCHRGKIHSSILLHILFNAWGLVISNLLTFEETPVAALIILIATIVCFTGGILSFHFGTKKICQNTN